MTTVLEILKYTLPSLVVFATAYYLLKQYITSQYDLKALEVKAGYSKQAIPLKLQAYERLLLFCDRISLPSLLLRLRDQEITAGQIKNAMIISVQKEYEHNMAQQLYASHKLWEIITLAKNDTIAIISNGGKGVSDDDTSQAFIQNLMKQLGDGKSPIDVAIMAIKEEAKIILNV